MTNRTKSQTQPSREQIKDRDEPVKLPLDPEEALRALLPVDPESEPVQDESITNAAGSASSNDRPRT